MANITITLTEGDKPLPNITTWDRFYQASLRAGLIVNPMDELDALLLAQKLTLEDGFQLKEVPATGHYPMAWGAGTSARKSQTYWFSVVRRMGLEITQNNEEG